MKKMNIEFLKNFEKVAINKGQKDKNSSNIENKLEELYHQLDKPSLENEKKKTEKIIYQKLGQEETIDEIEQYLSEQYDLKLNIVLQKVELKKSKKSNSGKLVIMRLIL